MTSPQFNQKISFFIKLLVFAGWVTLPLSHLRWLPDLGTTRPLSSILFTLAFGLIILAYVLQNGLSLANLSGWKFFQTEIRHSPGWPVLRWWVFLGILGLVSAAITPFYGNFFQALNRLLGYFLIFVFLLIAFYSLQAYKIETIARWTVWGYVPVVPYVIIEVMALLGIPWAAQVVTFVRTWLIVPFDWVKRVALLTTEPSFVSFQLLLLVAVFPFVRSLPLRLVIVIIIGLSLAFSQSATMFLVAGAYVGGLLLFSLSKRALTGLAAAGGVAGSTLALAYALSPAARQALDGWVQAVLNHPRIVLLQTSSAIRIGYLMNLIYVVLDTRGLGLGIGQYGQFWKSYYLRHIDYKAFDTYGEVQKALDSDIYMRPWSVIFGIGADLGIVGMALLFGFFVDIFRFSRSAHARAVLLGGIAALVGAYPIVTPHVWLALALMAGVTLVGPPTPESPPA